MSLTLPSITDLYSFWGDEADDIDVERAEQFLNLSANLFWLACGVEDDPTDQRLFNLVQLAIMDMAIYLLVTRDDVDAEYSPFVSEKVGSYSYSKSYSRVSSAVGHSAPTNVPLFDKVVSYFLDLAIGPWTTSEQVFHYGYVPLYQEAWMLNPRIGRNRGWYYNQLGALADDEGSYWTGFR